MDKEAVLNGPVYDGSKQTVRQAIHGYVKVFLDKSTSKAALTETLKHSKKVLPQPNKLPSTYNRLKSLIRHEMVTSQRFHACVNDCMLFVKEQASLTHCPKCGEDRFEVADALGRKTARRYFSYISLKQSLTLLLGCSNIAQVVQEVGGNCSSEDCTAQIVTDITESRIWSSWNSTGACQGQCIKIILGLNTDGVNPFHSSGAQYSMWPLILCIVNLPKLVRNKADGVILVGVVPSRNIRLSTSLEPDLDPYVELLVDELLSLCSTEIYSSYQQAPVPVKVELLSYMMDFQAYAKFFQMSGAADYLNCNVCLMRATRLEDCHKMVLLGHRNYGHIQRRTYEQEVMHDMHFALLARPRRL